LGFDGNLGTMTADLADGKATASAWLSRQLRPALQWPNVELE
jgi:hypothetical protein